MEDRQNHTIQEQQPNQDFNHRAYRWIERYPLLTLMMTGVGVGVLVVVYWAFQPQSAPAETGFFYNVPTPGQQLTRTLWDWLGLLVVPLAVAVGAAFISFIQKRTELDIAEKARKEDREIARQARESEQQIATDRLRQATLESYYDRMTALLIDHKLRNSAEDSEARSIARARTMAVGKGLDGERKGQLLAFLKVSGLIEKDKPIIDLRRVDLSELVLAWADLSQVDLNKVNLTGAHLLGTLLGGANLRDTILNHANLRGAGLSGADLYNVDLREADLRGATLSEANLYGANLYRANLGGSNLSGVDLRHAILVEANLSNANLNNADLTWADLSEAKIDASTKMSDKWRLVWEIVNRGANHRNLYGVELRQANLMGASLNQANLGKAILSEANLFGANLSGADLSGADLSGADLFEANLFGADLSGADLARAVNWTIDQLDRISSLHNTTMPDGVRLGGPNHDGFTYEEWKNAAPR